MLELKILSRWCNMWRRYIKKDVWEEQKSGLIKGIMLLVIHKNLKSAF